MRSWRQFLLVVAALLSTAGMGATERIPPAPPRYFNDYASVVSRATADRLNTQLEQFEQSSSNQLIVVIYPKMESDSSVEDYTVRVAQAWRAGQTGKNNGAVLFAFMASHDLYLQVGYGLEGSIPDALAKRIIEQEIIPRFRAGDIDGGLSAAVNAMIAATRGEYQGNGRTVANAGRSRNIPPGGVISIIILFWVLSTLARRYFNQPRIFLNPRRRSSSWWIDTGGGGWGGGGSGGSSGGGFSGGGGSFGGGGAGGKW